jgi:hypothetical protein
VLSRRLARSVLRAIGQHIATTTCRFLRFVRKRTSSPDAAKSARREVMPLVFLHPPDIPVPAATASSNSDVTLKAAQISMATASH